MRYLHPVGISDAFVASGTYIKKKDGVIVPEWQEEWSIHRQPDQATVIRVDISDHAQHLSLIAEAWISPPQEGQHIERVDISAFSNVKSPIRHVRATYTFTSNQVNITSTLDGEPHYAETTVPDQTLPHIESTFFIGHTTSAILAINETAAVITIAADILALGQKPIHEQWSILSDAAHSLEIGNRVYPARKIDLLRDDPPHSTVFIDNDGTLLKLQSPAEDTWIELKDYARARN